MSLYAVLQLSFYSIYISYIHMSSSSYPQQYHLRISYIPISYKTLFMRASQKREFARELKMI